VKPAESTIYYVEFGGLNTGLIGRRTTKKETDKDDAIFPSETEPKSPRGSSLSGQSMSDTYSFKEVSRLLGITEGRLRYWDRSSFVSPTGRNGGRRCYTFQDLVGVRSALTLLENGVSLQRARRLIGSLQKKIPLSSHPLGRMRIMSDSRTVVVAEEGHDFDVDSGQMLLDLNVSHFQQEVVSQLPDRSHEEKNRTAYEWYLEGCELDEDETTLAQAEEAYHQAIHLDPTIVNAYTNLGNLRYRIGHVADAKTPYLKAIEVDERHPEAHYNLGFLEFEEGNLKKAAACFSRAVELDGTFADAHFNVAITLFRLGEHDQARQHLVNYLQIEPTGPWAEIARKRLNDLS
jgi:DNA-binding transcriptional MerR regulator